jgi:acyl-CoA thioester hydrolase
MEQPEGFRHFVEVRVRFAETDAQGVVYHSNFLIYCEVGRAEYFRGLKLANNAERSEASIGTNQHFWRRKDREWDTVIAHAECDYRAPARFDDVLRVWTRIGHVGKSSYAFEYKIMRADGVVVCDAKTVQVAVHKETRAPHPLPEAFVAALRAYEAA